MTSIHLLSVSNRPPTFIYEDDSGQTYRTDFVDVAALHDWLQLPPPGDPPELALLRAALLLHGRDDPSFSRMNQRSGRRYTEERTGDFDGGAFR